MIRFGLIRRQLEVGHDSAEEKPGAKLARHEIGVLALPAQSGASGERLLHERRGVDENLDVRFGRPRSGDKERRKLL
jgi:hypothetical protein